MKKVVSVSPLDNFELSLEFDLHEKKVFDVKPYLHRGIFTQLQDRDYFNLNAAVHHRGSEYTEIYIVKSGNYEIAVSSHHCMRVI
jgi:hypothetical protein